MPLHIGEVQTDVQMESTGTSPGSTASDKALWEQLAVQRALQQRMLEDCARTCAVGNED